MPRTEGGGVGRGNGDLVFNGDRVSALECERLGKRMMARIAQQCECTWCH